MPTHDRPGSDAVARSAPLSFGQARLWLLDRLFPDDTVYNEVLALRLEGALDPAVLARAFDEIVRRHESLRTRFELRDGQPAQVVAASLPLDIGHDDLRELPEASRETEARRRLRAEARSRFDLAHGPLMRVRLLRLADAEHWLVVVMHHIVTDGWSAVVLWRELALLYGAFATGRPSPLPALPEQYADFALRQRDWLSGPSLEAPLAYWKRALDGLAPLELCTDRPRPAVANHAGGRARVVVDAAIVRRLKAISREARATPFMALGAAFHVLLQRYSGQDDIALGIPIAGRTRPSLEPLIGFFVNMLVLRADLGGAPTFVELLGRVRERALAAYEHQELPFERLVMELAPARDASRNPLFQASFAFHGAAPSAWPFAGLRAEPLDEPGGGAKFDLSLTLVESGGGLRGSLDYATALFDAATAENLARQYATLLASIAAHPHERIGRLALQGADERARCLQRGRGARTPFPRDARVEQLFDGRADAHPDAVAVAEGAVVLSYRELDERANRLAHALRDDGPVLRVGLCLERGSALIVAMLASLKAGAAYVPLDPEHPVERLQAILDDASVDAVVTEERWAARVPGRRLLCVDRDAARIAMRPATRPGSAGAAGDVACVMFTSGSTGRPKGVPVTHRAIANLVRDTDYVAMDGDDVVAHLSNPAFDAATFEIWGALANGARVVPLGRDTVLSPRALAAAIAGAGVTSLFVTTALFNAVARDAPGAFAACRQVLFGGEAVEPRWVREVLRAGPPRRLVHVYGPTETTTFATWHEVTAADAAGVTIPLGRPIANAEVYVLDAECEPVAPGVPGEIHIGGAGLAAGYLSASAPGAERFVRHPFSDDPHARLFRTGDRARCRDDGAIEFLGRVDRQVKIRGQRIELDEVEGALSRLPYVREAIVLARGDTSDARRIVAWLVPANPQAPPPDSLRRDLRRLLPDAMLPAATVWVPSLPLTANGKIDTRALPEPGEAPRRATTPPRDMFEGVLARIWEDLLGRKGIGVHDHFFEIGGHSLLAARLVDTIERETGLAVPLTALFADDTIDGLARALRDGAPDARAPIVAVHEQGTRPPFVFLHGDFQAGGFYSRALARALGPDQPTLIVHPHGLVGDAVPATIEAMAASRIAALRALCPEGPYVIGGHCNGALVAFEMARQLIDAGERVPAIILIESRAPRPEPPSEGAGGLYVKFDAAGRPAMLAPSDRMSDIELAYTRAIDAYRGGRCEGHVVVIQAEEWRDPAPDAGWARLARSCEGHVVPGGHVTLITRHLADLARTIREAIERALEGQTGVSARGMAGERAAGMPSA